MAEIISPEPRSQPRRLPRGPLGQAMAVSRGPCNGRALQRPRILHPVSYVVSHVCAPIPRRSPEYEATLAAPISCRNSRSTWAVWFCCTTLTTWYCGASSSETHGQGGNSGGLFDLITNQQQTRYFSVPGFKRSKFLCIFGGS